MTVSITKPASPLTKQQVFDRLWEHFVINKGSKSTPTPETLERLKETEFANVECAYRGVNGAKCAVGIFIPDDVYFEGMEGRSAFDLSIEAWFGEVFDISEDPDDGFITFMENVQLLHDKAGSYIWGVTPFDTEDRIRSLTSDEGDNFHTKMKLGLQAIAKEHNLPLEGKGV